MNFDQNEEQQLLAESVRRFVDKAYSFEQRRAIIASEDGYSRDVWKTLADLGLLGLPFSTEHGGFGGGAVDAMPVMEIIGDVLMVEPYLATVGWAGQLIARGGSPRQQAQWLPLLTDGKLRLAFAQVERGARYDLAHVAVRAKPVADGYRIDGEKCAVVHASQADKFIVSARTSGAATDPRGISLFLVDAGTAGVSMRAYRTIDGLRSADLTFDDAKVPADAIVGVEGLALPLIEEATDFATALLCAEAVGALQSANDATLEYLKTRKQFGVPIGSFQVLRHRMVDMVISCEQARSMASLACVAVDAVGDRGDRMRTVSAAKIRIADACRHVSQEAVQLHGGMGMSDEMKISHTFRRLTMIAQQFGDADYHLERFAAQ